MTPKKTLKEKAFGQHALKSLLVLTLGASLAMPAVAHRSWIVPSTTVLAGDDAWATFDAAISNTLFKPEYHAMRINGLTVLTPGGEQTEVENVFTGKYRTVFDLNLTEPGTYKVVMASSGLTARWEDENGERRMWPGRGQSPNDAEFDQHVPAEATNLQVSRTSRRMETFLTLGAPSDTVLQPTNQGLELVAITHPNDLYAGEQAEFRLLIDGEPAAGAEIAMAAGGMQFRDSQEEIQFEADDEGRFSISWPHPGMYWLEASYSDDRAAPPATIRSGRYVATFEVQPD